MTVSDLIRFPARSTDQESKHLLFRLTTDCLCCKENKQIKCEPEGDMAFSWKVAMFVSEISCNEAF